MANNSLLIENEETVSPIEIVTNVVPGVDHDCSVETQAPFGTDSKLNGFGFPISTIPLLRCRDDDYVSGTLLLGVVGEHCCALPASYASPEDLARTQFGNGV